MGGLPKKAAQLERLRQETGSPLLAVDGGALLFKTMRLDPLHAPQDKAAAAGIIEAYNSMGFDAVGINAYDLAAGLDFTQEMARRARFPWLSADLVHRNTGTPLFQPSTIIKKGALAVGVFALTGPAANSQFKPADQVEIRPWQEVVPPLLAALQKSCDLIILLSGLPESDNETLARRFPGLQLIIRAGLSGMNLTPHQVNNSLVLETEKQGKHLGVLTIRWNPSKRWGEDTERVLAGKQSELDRVNWFIRSHQRKGDPLELYRQLPAKMQAYQELLADQQRLQDEIVRLHEELAQGEASAAMHFDNRFLAMTADLPDHPAVQDIVTRTTLAVNILGRELARSQLEEIGRGDAVALPYAGWRKCAACHRTEADFWGQSRHARAYETLRARNQQYNRQCIACHVTGPTSGTEPRALALPEDLQAVSCEACHGPGRAHSTDTTQPMTRKPAPTVCLRCHTPEQDDDFNYQRDLARINCPHARP